MPNARLDVPFISPQGQRHVWRLAALSAFSRVPVPGPDDSTVLDLLLSDTTLRSAYQQAYDAVMDELLDQDPNLSPGAGRWLWRWHCQQGVAGADRFGRDLRSRAKVCMIATRLKNFLGALYLAPAAEVEQPWWLWEVCTATLLRALSDSPERKFAWWKDDLTAGSAELENPPQLGKFIVSWKEMESGDRTASIDYRPFGLRVELKPGEDPAAYKRRLAERNKVQAAFVHGQYRKTGVRKLYTPVTRHLEWFVHHQCARPAYEETFSGIGRRAGVTDKAVVKAVSAVAQALEVQPR